MLNAAHGRRNVDTGPDYYRGMDIEYHGVEADDVPTFDLSVFFYSAAAFIDGALHSDHSKSPAPPNAPPPRPAPWEEGSMLWESAPLSKPTLRGFHVDELEKAEPPEAVSLLVEVRLFMASAWGGFRGEAFVPKLSSLRHLLHPSKGGGSGNPHSWDAIVPVPKPYE